MKVEAWIFAALAVFVAIVTPVYWLLAHEVIGLVALILTFALVAMLAFYFFLQARKMDPRPEDRKDAEIIEGAGELGFFPPASIWPFWSALAVTVMALGPVFGWWLTILGVALGVFGVTGWCYQYYRGDFEH